MITRNNLKEVLSSLNKQEIINKVESDGDYIALSLYIFNTGYKVELESLEMLDDSYADEGNLCCDKDDFLRLLDETDNLPTYYK